jgi:tetratricopeptide (TPR) repeat protein/DNA-binding SARP family transcriptional activator
VHNDVQQLFDQGDFQAVFTALEGHASSGPEHRLYGLSLIYLGNFEAAELALWRAYCLGDAEGSVEYGNILRLLGRFDEAWSHLETIAPTLTGELQLRCQRWQGVIAFKLGHTQDGMRRVRTAWRGYIKSGDEMMADRVLVTMAQMSTALGRTRQAWSWLKDALTRLPEGPNPAPRLTALRNLAGLQIDGGDLLGAAATLQDAQHLAQRTHSRQEQAMLLATEADLKFHAQDYVGYVTVLETLLPLAEQIWEHELYLWATTRLAEHYSLAGQHGKAMATLMSFSVPEQDWPTPLRASRGIMAMRRGSPEQAIPDLLQAAHEFRTSGSLPELVRVLLHHAAAALQLEDHAGVATLLREALEYLLQIKQFSLFQADLQEVQHLLYYALLEPEIAPYLEPLLGEIAQLAGTSSPLDQTAPSFSLINISSLGRLDIKRNGQSIHFKFTGSLPILIFVLLNPGKTRAEIQLALFPEKQGDAAKSYLRQCFKDLRTHLGEDILRTTGPHQAPMYFLGQTHHVELDLLHFRTALTDGNIPKVLTLYRGPFFAGEFEESEWVTGVQQESLLALTLTLKRELGTARDQGDHHRVVLLANQYLRVDPHEHEVMTARLLAAKTYASAFDVAKYTTALQQLYN